MVQQPTLRETPVPSSFKDQSSVVGRIAEEVRNTGQQSAESTSADIDTQRESTTQLPTQLQQEQDRWLNLRGTAVQRIKGDVSPTNIVEGKRVRKQTAKGREAKQSQFTLNLDTLELNSFFYDAFITAMESYGLSRTRNRIHESELPPLPKNWKEMLRYLYFDGFRAAAEKEHSTLVENRT